MAKVEMSGVLHIASADGKGCRDCGARWFNDEKDRGLVVAPGTRVEHEGVGTGSVPGMASFHPLAATAGSAAQPCLDQIRRATAKQWP